MRVVLQIVDGPAKGREFPLQRGEVARVGSSSIADVSISGDPSMAAVHFVVECTNDKCRICDLKSGLPTTVTGRLLDDFEILVAGDVIEAGLTRFLVKLDEADDSVDYSELPQNPESQEPQQSARQLGELIDLDDESRELLLTEPAKLEFVDLLIQRSQFLDAIRFLTVWLRPEQAIWWAWKSVHDSNGGSLDVHDQSVLDSVSRWLADPTDEHRRAAMSAAESKDFETPADWVALAAFWSGGSIAPLDLAEVPADDSLVSKAVFAALLILSSQDDPELLGANYERITRMGRDIATGVLKFQEADC